MALVDYDLTMPNLDAYVVDGISGILALSNTMSENIELNHGWNLISTYIILIILTFLMFLSQLSIVSIF